MHNFTNSFMKHPQCWYFHLFTFLSRIFQAIIILPTLCDLLGTTLAGIGLLYVSASVWQMLRGSIIIFTGILSVILKRLCLIIIIIIFSFYMALITNVSTGERFTNILLPRSLHSVLVRTHCVHNLHSLVSIPARRYLTLKNCLTNNDGRILPGSHLTHGWRVASAG